MQGEAEAADRMGATSAADTDRQMCCSMTSALLSVVREDGGDEAVASVLTRAGTDRDLAHLENPDNWISLAEASALLAAGVDEFDDPTFARRVGEHTLRRHAGTQVSTLLRSLGSTEAVLKQVTLTAAKLSAVTDIETLEACPGRAVVRARARPGFERTRLHCDWAAGLIASLWLRSTLLPGIAFISMLVLSILISGIYPAILQGVSVKPNAASKEAPYQKRNILATREAYNISTATTAGVFVTGKPPYYIVPARAPKH